MTIPPGLTTSQSPFIEHARSHGDLYIHQPYELYSDANHAAWRALFRRMQPLWQRHATRAFLRGAESLCLDPLHVPRLDDVNRFLEPLTGFRTRPVSGYVPAFLFFDSLRNREFPTTITIRSLDSLDYLPEPDIFHDVAGHVPMHTDRAFAGALVRFGDSAHTAAEMAARVAGPIERAERLNSIIKAMARFFWFTVEFGLMNTPGGLKAYGSGLLSSHGELEHAVTSPSVQRFPIRMEWVINQSFEIDHYQPLLFVVEGFDHLYHLVGELEEWMRAGRLNQVAPGEPAVSAADIESFIQTQSRH